MPGFDTAAQQRLAGALKQEASRLGFDACGVSRAGPLDEEAARLEQWLHQGRHGTMGWMADHFDKRVDPRRLVDGARSVVSVLHNYYQPVAHSERSGVGKISRYAWGDDYHEVLKEKLVELFAWLDAEAGGIAGRAFVDSAPVMDKAWARRSGLGWMGKHANLINRSLGSFFFIGELIVDVPLEPDGPVPDHCGSCTRCIDACPTDAIYQPYAVDANRCIAYLTIEHRADDIPPALQRQIGDWIFGCDVCQDVCPWNKFKHPSREPRYAPRDGIVDTELQDWIELDIEAFRKRFGKNPVKRTKFEGFIRNVRMAIENNRPDPGLVEAPAFP
ncbi:MAG: tRNA epoxyqueuosine(34) reductase QueG [Rhodothermales bacterium]|nr:tRNA epoxyqueuosine(34) reductase QueG [Rhodothermales bacterium]